MPRARTLAADRAPPRPAFGFGKDSKQRHSSWYHPASARRVDRCISTRVCSQKGSVQMKKDIHPQYEEATVHCSCGNTFTTRSTKKELHVELCSQCHPFYTGKQKLVDSGGRVDRFKKRLEKKAADEAKAEKAPNARPPKPELKPEPTPEPVAVAAEPEAPEAEKTEES
jgi:large subunit ribosomal protein L31